MREFMSDQVDYNEARRALGEAGIDRSPSEAHGLMTGWICTAPAGGVPVEHWFGGAAPGDLLERMRLDVESALEDDTLGFRLLLPGDEASVNARTAAVSQWCGGFLEGFATGVAGRDAEPRDDVREILEDLVRISAVTVEVPDDDENEADLVEIGEYVRLSALLVFTEYRRREDG